MTPDELQAAIDLTMMANVEPPVIESIEHYREIRTRALELCLIDGSAELTGFMLRAREQMDRYAARGGRFPVRAEAAAWEPTAIN